MAPRIRPAEPWVEYLSRLAFWAFFALLGLVYQHIITRFFGWFWQMVGRRTEAVIKWTLLFAFLVAAVVVLYVWRSVGFDLSDTWDALKMLAQ